MLKKSVKIVLTFILCLSFMQIKMPVYATDSDAYFTVDNVKYKKISNSTVAIWDASGVKGDYSIPSKVKHNNSNYSVTQIGYKAFYGNEQITSVVMPDTVTKIQDGKEEDWVYYGAFKECINLKSVTFSKNLTYIGKFAFSGDEVLKNVTIPSKVKNIMNEAFSDCKGITKLTIPAATTYVGQCAFYGTSFVTFTIPNTCEDFHFLALDGIPTLTDIYVEEGHSSYTSLNGVMYSADMSVLECYPQGKKDAKYKLPKSVKILNMGVLSGNKYIKELVMNNVIDERGLGTSVIQDTNISTIKVSADNPYMKSVDGVLFSKNGDTLLLYPPAKKDEIYFVPSGTKHIGNGLTHTFETCQYLEELYVPASVETMTGIMWRSKKLKQVVFASESKLTSIDSAMFQDCTELQSICFPKSIKYLSKQYWGNEFLDCYSLETLYVAGGADIYNCDYFGCQTLIGCSNLTVYGEGSNNSLSKLAENFGLPYKDVSRESEKVLGVTFKDTIINIDKEENLSLNVVVYPKVKANEQLSFVSSDESIATVDSKGNVTGIKCGNCYITAISQDGAYARCQINVKHTEKTKVTAATTNKAGKIVTYCSECDKNISSTTIPKIKEAKLSYQSKIYTGKKLIPTVQIKNSSGKKINSKYYTVSYKNNKNVGVATVIIKFKGNYSGTVEKTFQLKVLQVLTEDASVRWLIQSVETDLLP